MKAIPILTLRSHFRIFTPGRLIFFGIQKGDHYKVVYENVYVEGKCIGIGRVLAASFNHYGKDNYAFYFVQDSVGGEYFDNLGKSLRRAF